MLQLVSPAPGDFSPPAALAKHGRSSQSCCPWAFLAIVGPPSGLSPSQDNRQMGGTYDVVTSQCHGDRGGSWVPEG